MRGVLHILKTPEDSSCVSEGNQPPRARQRKSSKQHTQREAWVPPQLYRDSLVKAKYDPYVWNLMTDAIRRTLLYPLLMSSSLQAKQGLHSEKGGCKKDVNLTTK